MKNKFIPEYLAKGFNSEKPIVFLDMDGTCNSLDYGARMDEEKVYEKWQIDPNVMNHLNRIQDWNFVLSSSWRRFMDLDKLRRKLERKGFMGKILDITPTFTHPAMVRGNEIKAWLDGALVSPVGASYVIFDDESDMLYEQRNHFIHIDSSMGITAEHISHAINIYI